MPKARRRRRADQFWRDAIAAWKESGRTATAFRAARGTVEARLLRHPRVAGTGHRSRRQSVSGR